MPSLPPRLQWYLDRLRSMPPEELPHRARELVHKRLDRRGLAARRASALPLEAARGPAPGLPVDRALLRESLGGERERLRGLRDRVLAGELTLLGRRWPAGSRRDWQLDPGSGQRWPADRYAHDIPRGLDAGPGDVKYVWELNRLQHLVVLALASVALDDAAAGEAALADIGAWIAENPPYLGVSWGCGIELASRVVSMLAVVGALGPERVPAPLAEALNRSLHAHGLFLARYPSLYSSANNHRVSEALALFLLGLLCPRLPEAAAWEREGRDGLERQITALILPDGVGAEQAPTYTVYTIEWYLLARQVGIAAGRPLSALVDRRLVLALEHLRAIMDRAGNLPHLGDDDGSVVLRSAWDRAEDARSVLGAAAALLGRPELAPPGARQDARAGLLGARVPSADGRLPPSRSFADGGLTALRHGDGDREALVVFDHGPLGYGPIAAHGHADALSVCLHLDGVPALIDPGAYVYNHSGGWREYLRSTLAHNTLEVGGQSQSVPTGAFNWGARAVATREALSLGGQEERVAASHDGYRARLGVLHRRVVSLDGLARLEVKDDLLGVGARRVRAAWHFGPELALAPGPDGRCWEASLDGRVRLRLRVEGPALAPTLVRQTERPGPGASSPAYNVLYPSWSLVFDGEARLPAAWTWRFELLP